MDLEHLRLETCIGLNKIFLGFEKFRLFPQYYVAVNDKVIAQSAAQIKALNCVKFLSQRGARHLIQEDALTYILNTDSPPERFVEDLSLGAHEGWTVTYVALQVAFFLGFEQVIIIGMDHRFSSTGSPNATAIMDGPDRDHFVQNYFGFGQSWDIPDLERSEESYRLANQRFDDYGRHILDATIDGACTIFRKCDYNCLF